MLLVVNVVSFASTLFSVRYMERFTAAHRYYSLFLLMVAGMNGVVLTGDLFNLFVFLEIASIASYALVAFGCEQDELEASFKYLVLGSIGSTLVLLGIALRLRGDRVSQHGQHLHRPSPSAPASPLLTLAFVFFVVGFGIKAALVPFHPWLPDAHPSAPAPISAMLSGVLIKALGVYALTRVLFNVIGVSGSLAIVLIAVGVLSMTVGVFLAVGQWDFKRLLAYHSISQMGYVILGIGMGGYILADRRQAEVAALAMLGGIFHLANHCRVQVAAVPLLGIDRAGHRHPAAQGDGRPGGAHARDARHLHDRLPVHRGSSAAQRVLEQADHRHRRLPGQR